jgi:DNA glycosylase AlkZ-like
LFLAIERECTLVKHASAFTQANDLAWNPQTLFRCQSTRSSVPALSSLSLSIHRLSRSPPAGGAPDIPIAEAKGFTAHSDKPAAKRRWGYYTLPILYGDRLVARLDPKLDRTTATLMINGFWLEEHAPVDSPVFAAALARGLVRFAEFLDARRVNIEVLEPVTLRAQVREHMGAIGTQSKVAEG